MKLKYNRVISLKNKNTNKRQPIIPEFYTGEISKLRWDVKDFWNDGVGAQLTLQQNNLTGEK